MQAIQLQKAELLKKEQELSKSIKQKADKLTERMKQLGIDAPAVTDSPRHRVGRIIIEGNEKTADREILEFLELYPGQEYDDAAVRKSNARLKNARFGSATVEVLPNESDSVYVDVRIKVTEK